MRERVAYPYRLGCSHRLSTAPGPRPPDAARWREVGEVSTFAHFPYDAIRFLTSLTLGSTDESFRARACGEDEEVISGGGLRNRT